MSVNLTQDEIMYIRLMCYEAIDDKATTKYRLAVMHKLLMKLPAETKNSHEQLHELGVCDGTKTFNY